MANQVFIIILSFSILIMAGCKEDVFECEPDINPMAEVYGSFKSNPNFAEAVTLDLKVHEYTFKMNQRGVICSVGYQNNDDFPGKIKIEIIDEDGTVLYNGSHEFSATETDYKAISGIEIIKDKAYTIRRTIEPVMYITETIGRIMGSKNTDIEKLEFPLTVGEMTIIETNFYGTGGPHINKLIPFIDFGYSFN